MAGASGVLMARADFDAPDEVLVVAAMVGDLGEFMRQCMDEWARRRKGKTEGQ